MWLADGEHKTLWRLEPNTGRVLGKIKIGRHPGGLRVGEGAVWLSDATSATVVRIDPRKNKVVARIPVGYRPQELALGGGKVWVRDTGSAKDGTAAGCSAVYSIDPRGNRIAGKIPVGPSSPGAAYVQTGGGRVWVRPLASVLLAINVHTYKIDEAIGRLPQSEYAGQVALGFGSLWLANWDDGTVWRIKR